MRKTLSLLTASLSLLIVPLVSASGSYYTYPSYSAPVYSNPVAYKSPVTYISGPSNCVQKTISVQQGVGMWGMPAQSVTITTGCKQSVIKKKPVVFHPAPIVFDYPTPYTYPTYDSNYYGPNYSYNYPNYNYSYPDYSSGYTYPNYNCGTYNCGTYNNYNNCYNNCGTYNCGSNCGNYSGSQTVYMQNSNYQPSVIYVRRGTTVTWVNQDSMQHTVTADFGSGPYSGTLYQGQSYSYTFSTNGTYPYHCQFHSGMRGTIVVTD